MAYHPTTFSLLVHNEPKKAKQQIREALAAARTVDEAATTLGIERTTLFRALKKLKIKSGKAVGRSTKEAR